MASTFNVLAQRSAAKFDKNEIFLLAGPEDLPSLEIDITQNHDSTLTRITEEYEIDDCGRSTPIDFMRRLNFGSSGFSIQMRFAIPSRNDSCTKVVDNCWDFSNVITVKINSINEILAENKLVSLDSLLNFLSRSHDNGLLNEFRLDWQERCSSDFLNEVMLCMCKSYLNRVEFLEERKIDSFSKKELKSIKSKYPFIITVGNFAWMNAKEIIIDDIEEIQEKE